MAKNFSDIIELNDLRYYFLILFMLKEMQIYIYIYIYDTNIYIYNLQYLFSKQFILLLAESAFPV